MDDLQFRLVHKDDIAKLEYGDDLTIRGCFFTSICSCFRFHKLCSQYHFKEYDDNPGIRDKILECALNRFFNKLWEQKKGLLASAGFQFRASQEILH